MNDARLLEQEDLSERQCFECLEIKDKDALWGIVVLEYPDDDHKYVRAVCMDCITKLPNYDNSIN